LTTGRFFSAIAAINLHVFANQIKEKGVGTAGFARWFIFGQKIGIGVKFGESCNDRCWCI
jgi:hypothetical protein